MTDFWGCLCSTWVATLRFSPPDGTTAIGWVMAASISSLGTAWIVVCMYVLHTVACMYVCMYHTYVQFKLVGNCLDCGEILQSTLYIYFVYIANARHWLLMICDRQDTHSAKHPLGCFYIVNALGHWLLRISVGQARFFAIRRAWGRVWYVGQNTCILPVPIPCLMEHLLIRQEAKYKMK